MLWNKRISRRIVKQRTERAKRYEEMIKKDASAVPKSLVEILEKI